MDMAEKVCDVLRTMYSIIRFMTSVSLMLPRTMISLRTMESYKSRRYVFTALKDSRVKRWGIPPYCMYSMKSSSRTFSRSMPLIWHISLNEKGMTLKLTYRPDKCVDNSPDNNLPLDPVMKMLQFMVDRKELIAFSN